MSSLQPGCETNAGLTWKLLSEQGVHAGLSVRYEEGIQWRTWQHVRHVITGKGLNRQIQTAYGALASRYHAGDRIFLFGYSRGAYAVRSLAGVIDRVGLVRRGSATARTINQAYRLYRDQANGAALAAFQSAHCHPHTEIEMIGVWDTVRSLGLSAPILWRYSQPHHAFHNHALGHSVRSGFQALALDETRRAYAPVLWQSDPEYPGTLVQMWFRGSHGDVGGHQLCCAQCRPLANIPLVWMLERAEERGLPLPAGWRGRLPCDVDAPSAGTMGGWGRLFLNRAPRLIGADPSETVHPSAADDPKAAVFRNG